MSAHLLLITFGPVQSFIEQSRRTRDLWFGSHVLSELARAGARALAEVGAGLILPALAKGDSELEPCEGFLRQNEDPEKRKPAAPIANKLLAELPEGLDPEETAREARSAVIDHWKRLAEGVRARCRPLLAENIDAVWDEQIETAVEFYAAWAPLSGDYAEARKKLERAIAGRKLLRDFGPWRHDRVGAPKSSFDGARVSVLAKPRSKTLARRLRIGEGEQLDAVALVKRAGGDPQQFPPIVNIALAAWLEAAAQHAPAELGRLRERARELDLPQVKRPDLRWTIAFPFDAEVLIESRIRPLFEELEIAADPELFLRHELRPLYRVMGEPNPYVACLVADGDRMGRALDAIGDPDAHRAFSKALAGFAAEVRRIVEQEHRGSLVYAGGDDALAFLPLVDAVPCAERLRERFEALVRPAVPAAVLDADKPTLSVGIGIGHPMEGMAALLELGREAEKLAKTQRNALALVLDKRSGGRREWLGGWPEDPAARLSADAALAAGPLSIKKIHEIGAILRRLPAPGAVAGGEAEAFHRVLEGEVHRALARNEGKPLGFAEIGLVLPEDYAGAHEAVARWVDRMLIARAIAEAAPRPRVKAKEAA
jgi:CRISPR-associated protein Cmr2